VNEEILQRQNQGVGLALGRVLIGEQLREGGILVVAGDLARASLDTTPPKARAPAGWCLCVSTLFLLGLPVPAQVTHTSNTGGQHHSVHDVGHTGLAAVERGFVSALGNITTTTAAAILAIIFRSSMILCDVQRSLPLACF
jgi:hypothetical protein